MDMDKLIILIKVLSKIPRSWLIKLGYSGFGSNIIRNMKQKKLKKGYEIDNGIKIYLDLTNPLTWELILEKDFEKKVKNTFIENIKESDTVIDVGANIGEYSLLASKIIGPNGKIFAIEPLSDISKKLKENFLLNNFSNFEILEKAVGETEDQVNLYKKNQSGNIGFIESSVDGKNLIKTEQIIEVDTLDNIIANKKINLVNMLKIDVEGFEYNVLLGCKKSLNKIEKIICEIHLKYLQKKGQDELKILSFLKENGFSIDVIEKLDSKGTMHILAKKC